MLGISSERLCNITYVKDCVICQSLKDFLTFLTPWLEKVVDFRGSYAIIISISKASSYFTEKIFT